MKKQLTSVMVLSAALLALILTFVSCNGGGNKNEELASHLRVASIEIFPRNMTLLAGDSGNFLWKIEPDTAANKTVRWESGNSNIARVANGAVTGVADGTTTIKASSEQDPSKSVTCQVLIVSQGSGFVPVTGVSLNKASTTLAAGDTETLTATVLPSNATDKTVSWFSDNVTVARVSDTGVVTAVGNGTATISVIANYGGRKATCAVTVSGGTNPGGGADVYVAGWEYNAQGKDVATLWKNGVPQRLSDGSYEAYAHSVFVSGNDVYVAGGEYNAQGILATLWKNGVPQRLSDGRSYEVYALSVFVK
jgi:uncharacterized protein YjdB